MLNTVSLMGRLTRDPELRYTPNQDAVANFGLAVERDYITGGERKADFVDCTAWKNTAEFIAKYFSKGTKAVVNGRITVDYFTDKEGVKRKNTIITVSQIYFAESNKKTDAPGEALDSAPTTYSSMTGADEWLPF